MKHLTKEQFKPMFEEASETCANLVKQSEDPITAAMAMLRVAVISMVAAVGQEEAARSASDLVNVALRESAALVKEVEEEDENFPTA